MAGTLITCAFEAYERWATTYPPQPHNPLMRAEQQAMLKLFPDVTGNRVLDLACGSGRYASLLRERGASEVVAVDFSPAMLRQAVGCDRVRSEMTRLPFAAATFAAVICGLAVGHAADLSAWMRETARVLKTGGRLLYSDFHPEASRAGLTRSFKDETSRSWQVPHFRYDVAQHKRTAEQAGLRIEALEELRVGMEFCEPFPGSDRFFQQWHGLPLILVVRACADERQSEQGVSLP